MVRRVAVAVLVALSALSTVLTSAAFADEFGSHAAGQHVYDGANVLRPEQVQMLERRAATLDALAAPTIVYVGVEAATRAQAREEARELTDAWDVESAHGAHDGFVMPIDLTPGTTQHGQVGIVAGAEYATAKLDGDELDRIATDMMRPSSASRDLAGGISAGLEATAEDLGGPASAGGTSNHPGRTTAATTTLPSSITALTSSLPDELGAPLAGVRGRGWTDSASSWSGGGDGGGTSF